MEFDRAHPVYNRMNSFELQLFMNAPTSTPVTQMGIMARTCLAPGQRGKVLAAFSGAIYLVTDSGEVLWISLEGAPLHQRCTILSNALPGLTTGVPFFVDGHRLVFAPDLVFDMEASTLWDTPRIDPEQMVTVSRLRARVRSLFANLDISQAKGFGTFIPNLLPRSISSTELPPDNADSILSFAQPIVLDIALACSEHRPSRSTQKVDALVGLGPGLTPSGDDFLGGLFFITKAIRSAYPDLQFTDYEIPVETYRTKTNSISFTYLNDLVNGNAPEPLHRLTNALLSGEPLEDVHPMALKLTQIGHSTGWDLLTGFLTGLLIIA